MPRLGTAKFMRHKHEEDPLFPPPPATLDWRACATEIIEPVSRSKSNVSGSGPARLALQHVIEGGKGFLHGWAFIGIEILRVEVVHGQANAAFEDE